MCNIIALFSYYAQSATFLVASSPVLITLVIALRRNDRSVAHGLMHSVDVCS